MFVAVRMRLFRLFAACLQSGDLIFSQMTDFIGAPKGIRTPVFAVKGRRPRPLDDGDQKEKGIGHKE